jgi:hypothetical protein
MRAHDDDLTHEPTAGSDAFPDPGERRRDFLKGALAVGGIAASLGTVSMPPAQAQPGAVPGRKNHLMTTRRLSEDEAISLMSVAVDFGITQVVDGNWGVHATIKKAIFAGA